MISFLKEFWLFLRVRKKFWLLPILLVMAVFGGVFALAKGSVVGKSDLSQWGRTKLDKIHRNPKRVMPQATVARSA